MPGLLIFHMLKLHVASPMHRKCLEQHEIAITYTLRDILHIAKFRRLTLIPNWVVGLGCHRTRHQKKRMCLLLFVRYLNCLPLNGRE
jgi:hypothetical protein